MIRTIPLKFVIDHLYHGRRDDGLWEEPAFVLSF